MLLPAPAGSCTFHTSALPSGRRGAAQHAKPVHNLSFGGRGLSRSRCDQLGHIDRITVARQNVWQVLDQRPSRLARRMAVREERLTRTIASVKTHAKGCGLFYTATRAVAAGLVLRAPTTQSWSQFSSREAGTFSEIGSYLHTWWEPVNL